MLLGALPGRSQQYVISTLLGGKTISTPAVATSSWIGNPDSLRVGPAGEVYFTSLHSVFKVTETGQVVRVAGTMRQGYFGDGGLALNAQLLEPQGLAFDAAGNLYIADSGNHRIRRVAADGVITTVAGNGVAGSTGDGGPAVSASLTTPSAVLIDPSGNLVIADAGDNRVRRVTPAGIISTFVSPGLLKDPTALAMDGSGNLFIADAGNNVVREISPLGVLSGIIGLGLGLNFPDGVAVDVSGSLFISDSGNHRIVRLTSFFIGTFAGNGIGGFSGDGSQAAFASFYYPNDVAVDSSGNIYVADSANGRIRRIGSNGVISTFAGNGPTPTIDFPAPTGIAASSSGDIYFTDLARHSVRRLSVAGLVTTVAGTGFAGFSGDGGPAVSAELDMPIGIAADSQGNLYIADAGNNRIRKIAANGAISTIAGDGSVASLWYPQGVAVDSGGSVYIADTNNNRIRRVAPNGTLTTIATGVKTPTVLAVGADGTIYIAETGNNQVRIISGTTLSTIGAATVPNGIAVDPAGNVWYSDTGGNTVRQLKGPSSVVVAGAGVAGYSGDGGPASIALLSSPGPLAVDGAGNILVVDTGNGAIRVLKPNPHNTIISAVYDAAAEAALPVSPGKIVVIYGTGLGPSTLAQFSAQDGLIGPDLGGTKVTFNGIVAPVIYTSAAQVAAIVPYGVAGTTAQVTVAYGGEVSAAFAVPTAPSSPAIFTSNSTGAGQAAAINVSTGSLNTALSPAHAGEYVSLYLTGEGLTTPDGSDGKLAALPLPAPKLPVSAFVGGLPAPIQYAGAVPGIVAGLMQVNVLVPQGVQPGGYVPVAVTVGTASTSTGTWISVAAK